jgi:amidohydrolase
MSASIKEQVKQLAQQNFSKTVGIRHHLHAYPELSFEEYKTAAYVTERLKDLGLAVESKASTGLVALIEGNNPSKKIVALRADMDALPIVEQNDVPYKSQNKGVMHACGHDVHTSSLLGCAEILVRLKHSFEGTVKLVFQPGEEKLPGGASIMIKEGVLQNPAPQNIVGQHVMPLIEAGKVGFRSGMYMASTDEIYITVTGKGGHAAMPENFIDPIAITATILVALQQIVSRAGSPKIPTVLSFGKIIGEGATNVIPNEVKVEGTFRTMDEAWRADAHAKMKKMAEGIAESMGAKCHLEVRNGYPFLKNNPQLAEELKGYAIEYLGQENVLDLDLWMAGEDFAYYSQQIDANFYRLGVRNESKGIISGVHTPTFDVDEKCLEVGPGLMAYLTLRQLGCSR